MRDNLRAFTLSIPGIKRPSEASRVFMVSISPLNVQLSKIRQDNEAKNLLGASRRVFREGFEI